MPTRYQRGRDNEYRAQRELEADGYTTIRSAGSHGTADVIAWNATSIRFIQIKSFIKRMTDYTKDIAQLTELVTPPNATRELWIRQQGQRGWLEKRIIT